MFDFTKIADAEKLLRDFMAEVLTRLKKLESDNARIMRKLEELENGRH